METWSTSLIDRLSQWHPILVYGFLALSAVLENIVPPVPGDAVVVISAYLVGRGVLDWRLVYLCTCIGGLVGFLVMYKVGLVSGRRFLAGRAGQFFGRERFNHVQCWLHRYGIWLVLGNRFLSGIRTLVALTAGVGRMTWPQVIIWGGLSMAIWNGLLLCLGQLVGQNWELVMLYLRRYNVLLVSCVVLGAGLFAWRRWIRHQITHKG